jgi:hypothetical protein
MAKEIKHKLTAEDFVNNPDLLGTGLKVGDEISYPDPHADGEAE